MTNQEEQDRINAVTAQIRRLQKLQKRSTLTKRQKAKLASLLREYGDLAGPVPAKKYLVSDHALVRYMGRVLGYDVEAYRRQLHDLTKPYNDGGAEKAKIGGVTFVFANNVLKTVIVDGES